MKNKFLITLTAAFISITGFSQTTLEEYNYVVKGYKVQVESGLDMKKGYELTQVDKTTAGERVVSLSKLVKVSGAQKKTVAYMVAYNKSGGATEYICIPQPNSEESIMNMYWSALYAGSGDSSLRLQIIAYLLSRSLIW